MIVRFRLGNITETRPVHGKLDHHVSAGRKRDGFKQLHVSVEFTKYGNTLFRPVTKLYGYYTWNCTIISRMRISRLLNLRLKVKLSRIILAPSALTVENIQSRVF